MRNALRSGLIGVAVLATAGVAAGARSRSPAFEAATIESYSAATLRRRSPHPAFESAIPAPAAAAPGPGAVLNEGPILSWRSPPMLDGVRVELSPSADFDDAAVVRYDVRGEELGLPAVPGTWYWRLRGRSAGAVGDTPGPTRSFTVRPPPSRARPPRSPDEPDWSNPYDLLLRGISPGPWSDMR
jgi:hypothetical protein